MYDEPWDIDTKEMREDFPDGFYWDCCGEYGRTPGCETARHKTDSDPSDSEDDERTQRELQDIQNYLESRQGKKQKP